VCTEVKGRPAVSDYVDNEVTWKAEGGSAGEEDVPERQHGVGGVAASKDVVMKTLKQGGHRGQRRVRKWEHPCETGGALDGDSQK
jgi:hypothetical protein